MSHGTCKVVACGRRSRTRGMCDTHYRRWRKYGDAGGVIGGSRVCQGCSVPLVKKPGPGPGPWPKWCDACLRQRSNEASRDVARGGYIPPSRRGECSVCGKTVAVGPMSLLEPTCVRCRREAWFDSPIACAFCGAEFNARRSRDGWTRTCSKSCAGKLGMREGTRRSPFPNIAHELSDEELARRVKVRGELSRRRRRARLAGVASEPYTAAEIAVRDGFRCGICQDVVDVAVVWPDPGSASVDHVVPLSRGGDDMKANVQLAHFVCNMRKGRHVEPVGALTI